MSPLPPPLGCIQLNLCPEENLYLNIPIVIITSCCRKPFAYLRYVGWCVLGVLGDLRNDEGNAVSLDNEHIDDQTIYEYHTDSGLQHAIDPEVLQLQASSVLTTDTEVRVPFSQLLLPRDGFCVWTGLSVANGMHIIPFARGNEWFDLIVKNRSHEGEDLEGISINDIRNGIMGSPEVHQMFKERKVAVLMTPNPILNCEDIPSGQARPGFQPGVTYPVGCRYTLQWIMTDIDNITRTHIGHNNDAVFCNQDLPKPSNLLLHYNYGAAMVQCYGVNREVLRTRAGVPRPTRTVTDCNRTIDKLQRVRDNQGQGQWGPEMSPPMDGTDEKSSEREVLDGDEIVLRFWANTKVARERRAKEETEKREQLEDWRSKITS